MSDPCAQVRVELAAGRLSPDSEAHARTCEACRAAVAAWPKLDAAPPPPPDALLARVKAGADAELRAHPQARAWTTYALGFALVAAVDGLFAAKLLGSRPGLPPPAWSSLAAAFGFTASAFLGCWAALTPRLRDWRWPALAAIAFSGAVVVATGASVEQAFSPDRGWTGCFTASVLISLVPLAAAAIGLRSAAPNRLRALLAALAAGAGAQLVLFLHCPDTHLGHLATAHLLGWVALAVVAVPASRLLRPESYAP